MRRKIPTALAAWSFNFSLLPVLPNERKIPPASATWSFNFSLKHQLTEHSAFKSEKLRLHAAEAGGIFDFFSVLTLAKN